MTSLLPFPQKALDLTRFAHVLPLLSKARNALAAQAFPATVLLVGEPGGGREALAVELAAMLICPEGGFQCSCSSCQRVRAGLHPDLQVLSVGPGHQEIRLEDVQHLLEGFRQVPFEGKKRVYLLANAHTPPLNTFAASALLKTLEEPVPHAHWLLLAANPLRVLPTIVSRAVPMRLPPAPALDPGWGPLSRQLAERVPGSWGALEAEGEQAESFLAQARELLTLALEGDLLALLRLAALAKESPARVCLLASLALSSATQEEAEKAEAFLQVAELWLRAQALQERLRLPLEAVAVASMASLGRENPAGKAKGKPPGK